MHIALSLLFSIYLLAHYPLVMVCYLTFIVFDRSPSRGGYAWCRKVGITSALRGMFLWRLAGQYFPLKLYKTAPLPPGVPYVFGVHPHGVIAVSAMGGFGTDLCGFSKLFPGVDVHLLGLKVLFYIPFFREFVLAHGHATPGEKTILRVLCEGRSVCLAVGGAAESLDAHGHENCVLTLAARTGFVRLALASRGAHLVPVFSFGENEVYHAMANPEGSLLRRAQELCRRFFGFTFPVFCGRLWMPLMPLQRPLHCFVGAPIVLPHVPDPSKEDIYKWHGVYMDALRALFEKHKQEAGFPDQQLIIR